MSVVALLTTCPKSRSRASRVFSFFVGHLSMVACNKFDDWSRDDGGVYQI